MTVSFSGVPSNIRVPLFYAEMDNSKANTAQTSAPSLLIGQALADASIERNKLVLMPSADQARKMCGSGSPLARMVDAYRKTDPFGELYVIAVNESALDTAATGEIQISGKATAAGAVSLYVGSKRVQGVVSADDTPLQVAQSLAEAINAVADLPVTASAVEITENIPVESISINYDGGDLLPGATATLTAEVSPDNATNKAIEWSSSDDDAISIGATTNNGLSVEITAGSEEVAGTVITATSVADPTKTATVSVDVAASGKRNGQNAPLSKAAVLASAAGESKAAAVTLTVKYSGTAGNDFPLTLNYFGTVGGEAIPDGLSVTIKSLSGGAGMVDLAPTIAAMGDEPFDFIGLPFNDSANLGLIRAEMNDSTGRWSWSRQLYGHVYTAKSGSLTDLVAFGDTFNDQHLTICGYEAGTQSPVDELIGSRLGRQAAFIRNDPARPTQTGEISGALPAPVGSRFTLTERQSLLMHGIATAYVNSGSLMIERDITTYQTNQNGVADNSYLDSETLHTSAYVIRKLKTVITSKYPRHKLANDGTRFGPGQAIVTPAVLKGEICAAYRQMELEGIVENFDVFKTQLIVERNANDPNRVDVLFPPDYVNQLRVLALLNQFRLQYSNEEISANA